MSHIYTYPEKIENISSFVATCQKKNATEIQQGQHTIKQYGSNSVDCIASFKLPGWRYKIAVTDKGELKYDHWGSIPEAMDRLGEAIQDHWVEEVESEIDWTEVESFNKHTLDNGDIKMVLEF